MSSTREPPTYESSVFINCPFDTDYAPLFRAIVFTLEFCHFRARCSLEIEDSGVTRAEKLIRIIRNSRFGIHDISRTESSVDGLPRFNMPYEFGIFIGQKFSGIRKQSQKSTLVLDREKYRYQRYFSDIAGQDIRSHAGHIDTLIRELRSWLQGQVTRHLPGSKYLCEQYAQFNLDLPRILQLARMTQADLENYHDFLRLIGDWIEGDTKTKNH